MCNAGRTNAQSGCPFESWMQFMSCALYTFGYCLAIVQSDLVGYLRGRFRYNLVSCTLFWTQSWVLKCNWDSAYDTRLHGIAGSTWGKWVLKECGNKKILSKIQWKKGPRKGCCHGAVVGIAWAVPDNNVFYRTSISYIRRIRYKFDFVIQKCVILGSIIKVNI